MARQLELQSKIAIRKLTFKKMLINKMMNCYTILYNCLKSKINIIYVYIIKYKHNTNKEYFNYLVTNDLNVKTNSKQ